MTSDMYAYGLELALIYTFAELHIITAHFTCSSNLSSDNKANRIVTLYSSYEFGMQVMILMNNLIIYKMTHIIHHVAE